MSDTAGPPQFTVQVDGIGTFVFQRRNMRVQFPIEVEYARLTEGFPQVTDHLGNLATAFADLKILTIEAPPGWNIEELDGFDPESYKTIMKVWSALRDKEIAFRVAGKSQPQKVGEGAG